MTKDELKAFIEGEGKGLINELGFKKLDKNTVENFLQEDNDGKAIYSSIAEKEYQKRFKTFQENELGKLVEAEYLKKNPNLSETDKKIRALEQANEEFKKGVVKSNNLKQLKEINKDYNLPEDVFEMLVTDNLEESKAKITDVGARFKTSFEASLEKALTEKLGGTSKPLGTGDGAKTDVAMDEFDKIMNGGR